VVQAIEMLQSSRKSRGFSSILEKLKKEDPVAFAVVDVYVHTLRNQHSAAVAKGKRLLRRIKEEPLVWRLLIYIGGAHRNMGEMDSADSCFLRALEITEKIGDKKALSQVKFQIYANMLFRAEYEKARRELLNFKRDPEAWEPHWADYFLGVCALVRGQIEQSIKHLDSSLAFGTENPFYFGALEMKGLALRLQGDLVSAMESFSKSATSFQEYSSSYSAFPVAKSLEISRLADLEPPPKRLISRSLSLAKKGSWGERAAAHEIEALLLEDDAEAAKGLFEASNNYIRAYQNIEAVLSGLTSAYLAWSVDSPIFTKALKLIAPLIPLHMGFEKDSLLGEFITTIEPLANKLLNRKGDEGIRAYLIGGLRVLVDGKEIRVKKWHRNRAIRAFVYLLLSPKHRLPMDHLFYLLWPRIKYSEKTRGRLYIAISTVRSHLGRASLLTQNYDFYQLEDTWTDLEELENLIRLADATQDPDQKEEYLSRARELAQGELLPEFPYDRHIDEYRQYYKRLRKKLGLK